MARKRKAPKRVETITHEEASRTNIPTAEYQSVMREEQQNPVRVAYERRNRDLDPQLADVDGVTEERSGTVSVFNGPEPVIRISKSPEDETQAVGEWLANLWQTGLMAQEIGVFVRSTAELDRAREAVERSGLPFKVLDESFEAPGGRVSISTMHLAKGLEFRAIAVMACDDEVIPSQGRIETVADEADLEEVYDTERHLLYVACTRARDYLLVTSGDSPSEFLDDLRA